MNVLSCLGQVALPQKLHIFYVNVFIVHVLDFKFCFLWAKAISEAVEPYRAVREGINMQSP